MQIYMTESENVMQQIDDLQEKVCDVKDDHAIDGILKTEILKDLCVEMGKMTSRVRKLQSATKRAKDRKEEILQEMTGENV